MTDRELMQQALAALNDCHAFLEHDVPTANSGPERRAAAKAITALSEGTEQPQRTHWEGCDEVHPECKTMEKNNV